MDTQQTELLTTTFGSVSLEQHTVKTQDNYTLALYRIKKSSIPNSTPVVFVHGAYSNKHFWLSPKGKGIARFFAEADMDVWLLETRGHGQSFCRDRYKEITADEAIQYDFSASSDYIKTFSPKGQIWIGHSYGGLYLSFALGADYLPQEQIAACCVIGTQIDKGQNYLRFNPLAKLFQLTTNTLGKFPSKALKLGGEDEPPAISNQFIDWKNQGKCVSANGVDYLASLNNIKIPFLALAGGGDQIDPVEGCEDFLQRINSQQKSCWVLAKAKGWQKDYGHADMVIGKTAEAEVWPKLRDWAKNQASVKATTAEGATVA